MTGDLKLNPIGSGKPNISIVDAAIVTLSKELELVKGELSTQRSESKNIIIGVLIAFIIIVVTVAVSVLLSDYFSYKSSTNDSRNRIEYSQKINDQEIQMNDLKNKVDNLKILNPYLK